MKKILIIISIILIILSIGIYYNNKTIRIFESIDIKNIDKISIRYIGGTFSTKDKKQISEIMNYLNTLNFSKCSNTSVPNTTPDAGIALINKDRYAFSGVEIYGDVALLYPKKKEAYTISAVIYNDLENLCKKYSK